MGLANEELVVRTNQEKIGVWYLFSTFLRIGMVAFGGHMALISVVQREMAEKDRVISTNTILNAVGIASLLPGPVAVNVVAYIGYHLRGKSGAAASMVGILFPALSLMLILSFVYFRYSYIWNELNLMYYVTGVIAAIIISSGLQMFRKEIQGNLKKRCFCIATVAIQVLFNNYWVTIALVISGGILGQILKLENAGHSQNNAGIRIRFGSKSSFALGILMIIELLFITDMFRYFQHLYAKIALVFSGISLSLFGGGYVMIPIMQSLFVDRLHWLTNQEFIDAIAFSQVTPGPILISAAFTGFKLAGLAGALLATVAIFLPSAILMLIVSGVFEKNKENYRIKNALGGIKAVVVGMIIASGLRIAFQLETETLLIILSVIAFILSYRFRVSPVYLILSSIAIGLILKYI